MVPHPDGVSLPRDLERPVLHPSALGVPGADLRLEPGARPRGSELSLFNRRRRVARVLELREHGLAARLGQDSCHGGLERVDALAESDVERLLRRDGALVRRDALLASRDVRLGDARVLDQSALLRGRPARCSGPTRAHAFEVEARARVRSRAQPRARVGVDRGGLRHARVSPVPPDRRDGTRGHRRPGGGRRGKRRGAPRRRGRYDGRCEVDLGSGAFESARDSDDASRAKYGH